MLTSLLSASALRRASAIRRYKKQSRAGGVRKTSGNGSLYYGGLGSDMFPEGANTQSVVTLLDLGGVVGLLAAVFMWLGACTIFARANPKLSWGKKLFMYIVFLAFGDIYIFYFLVRITVQNLRQKRDYETLPQPAPYFG
jgi:hypothetical protein